MPMWVGRFVLSCLDDSRRDHRGAVAVAHVVLHDKYGAHAALLAANDRAQVGVKYLAALYSLLNQNPCVKNFLLAGKNSFPAPGGA